MLGIGRQGGGPQGDFSIPSGSAYLTRGCGWLPSERKVRLLQRLLIWSRKYSSRSFPGPLAALCPLGPLSTCQVSVVVLTRSVAPPGQGPKLFKSGQMSSSSEYLMNSFFFNFKIFIFLRERGKGREKKRERNISVRKKHISASRMHPNWGPNPQPHHVP